jgi:hypothetical protein
MVQWCSYRSSQAIHCHLLSSVGQCHQDCITLQAIKWQFIVKLYVTGNSISNWTIQGVYKPNHPFETCTQMQNSHIIKVAALYGAAQTHCYHIYGASGTNQSNIFLCCCILVTEWGMLYGALKCNWYRLYRKVSLKFECMISTFLTVDSGQSLKRRSASVLDTMAFVLEKCLNKMYVNPSQRPCMNTEWTRDPWWMTAASCSCLGTECFSLEILQWVFRGDEQMWQVLFVWEASFRNGRDVTLNPNMTKHLDTLTLRFLWCYVQGVLSTVSWSQGKQVTV